MHLGRVLIRVGDETGDRVARDILTDRPALHERFMRSKGAGGVEKFSGGPNGKWVWPRKILSLGKSVQVVTHPVDDHRTYRLSDTLVLNTGQGISLDGAKLKPDSTFYRSET